MHNSIKISGESWVKWKLFFLKKTKKKKYYYETKTLTSTAIMQDPHPAQLERLMKEGFSVWSRTTSFLSEEHSHSKLPVSSCGATPTTPARRYLRRGRRVTGRGRSETSPTGTDPHSHLRDTNCHHMHTFLHSTECVSATLRCRIQRSMYMWKSCRYKGENT